MLFRRLLVVLVVGMLCLGVPAFPMAAAAPAPETLGYVESSGGLGTPALEGGNTEIEFGDLNADGNLDLVSIGDHGSPYVNTDEHGIMVWFGNGAGTWSVYQNGDFGYGGVGLGDANNDGHMDAVYAMHHNYSGVDFGDQLIEVALGDGTGQNWTPWDDGLATNGETWGMFDSDFADVNNDGLLDVGSMSFGCCAGIHVYLNQGDGTWVQSFGFLGGNTNHGFTFGDVNGDGFADMAAGQQYGTVYLGDGNGEFALSDGNLPPGGDQGRLGPWLGDVNDDGRDEVSFCNTSGGVDVWAWGAGNVWADLSGALPSSGNCEVTQIRDMNADGHGDVLAFGESLLQVWTGNGAGSWTLAASLTTPTPGYFAAFRAGGDADHNGFPDIAVIDEEGPWPNSYNHLHFYKEASVPVDLTATAVRPRGGETLYAGSVRFLDWLSAVPAGQVSTVAIDLSTSGPGGPWQSVAVGLPNNGRYQWLLPDDLPSTTNAYLRYTVTSASDSATAITPAGFAIVGGTVLPKIHVDAIRMAGRTAPRTYKMKAQVRIRDANRAAVPGAMVYAQLTAPSGGVQHKSSLTNLKGVAKFAWASVVGGAWEACVEDVVLAGYEYDPSQNIVTCRSLVYP